MDPFAPADPRPNTVLDEPPADKQITIHVTAANEATGHRDAVRAKLDALQEVESILLDLDQTPDRDADIAVIRAYMTPLENILNEKE